MIKQPTLLRRLGNKSRISDKIVEHFPKHDTYIEMFFGAGGLFFNKPEAKYNFLNDLDSDIFNLFQVVRNQPEELYDAVELMPIHNNLFQYWRHNQEDDPIWKAVRFLMLSNFGFLGKPQTLLIEVSQSKKIALKAIKNTFEKTRYCHFLNCDFRDVLNNIKFRADNEKDNAFIYADPPYLNTGNNYQSGFSIEDTTDLFTVLVDSDIRFAISEFKNPVIMELAERFGLNVIEITERQSLGNRNTEILVTNYKNTQLNLFAHK